MPLAVRRRVRPGHDTLLRVVDPIRKRDYPEGVFQLPDADLKNPNVRRLLPPNVPGFGGGRFGDLEVVAEADAKGAPIWPPSGADATPPDDKPKSETPPADGAQKGAAK